MCSRSSNRGELPSEHTCNKNYSGPSTGMESALLVQGFNCSEELYGVRYNRFIGDGDSSVHAKILQSNPYKNTKISKIECRNHLFRNLRRKIVVMSNNTVYPLSDRKIVTRTKILDRLLRGIKMAVQHWIQAEHLTTAEKAQALVTDIENAPFHIFGNHEKCAAYFCNNQGDDTMNSFLKTKMFGDIAILCQQFSRFSESLIFNLDSNGGKRVNYTLARSYLFRCNAAQHSPRNVFFL